MSIDSTDFRKIMGNFATGVTVVTTLDGDGSPYGVTVNAFTSVSLDPLLVLVCLDNRLTGLPLFLKRQVFAINILNHKQQPISNYFATSHATRTKYLGWRGTTGAPLIRGCLGHLECRLETCHSEGDHQILVGRVVDGRISSRARRPLLYFSGRYAGIDASPSCDT